MTTDQNSQDQNIHTKNDHDLKTATDKGDKQPQTMTKTFTSYTILMCKWPCTIHATAQMEFYSLI